MNMAIKPTVGRKVWYHPHQRERDPNYYDSRQPFDATITYVHDDGTVNLDVVNESAGRCPGKTQITLRDTYDDAIAGQAGWMPYQVKTTARMEEQLANPPVLFTPGPIGEPVPAQPPSDNAHVAAGCEPIEASGTGNQELESAQG
jgi:hypothetical protein